MSRHPHRVLLVAVAAVVLLAASGALASSVCPVTGGETYAGGNFSGCACIAILMINCPASLCYDGKAEKTCSGNGQQLTWCDSKMSFEGDDVDRKSVV